MLKICCPCWIATTRRLLKLRAVAAAIDLVDDRRVEVAAAQEIGMQRVHRAALDRAAGRHERLAEHLSTEYLRAADVAALAAEQVHLETLELEQADQVGELLVHLRGPRRMLTRKRRAASA